MDGDRPRSVARTIEDIAKIIRTGTAAYDLGLPDESLIVDLARTIVLQVSAVASFLGVKLPAAEVTDEMQLTWNLNGSRVRLQFHDIRAISYPYPPWLDIHLHVDDLDGNALAWLKVNAPCDTRLFYEGLFNWFDPVREAVWKRCLEETAEEHARAQTELEEARKERHPDLPFPPEDTTMKVWQYDLCGELQLIDPLDQLYFRYKMHPPRKYVPRRITPDEARRLVNGGGVEPWTGLPREIIDWIDTMLHNYQVAEQTIGMNLPELYIYAPGEEYDVPEEPLDSVWFEWQESDRFTLTVALTAEEDNISGGITMTSIGPLDDPSGGGWVRAHWMIRRRPGQTLRDIMRDLFA